MVQKGFLQLLTTRDRGNQRRGLCLVGSSGRKREVKLGGHTEGPFSDLRRTTRKFLVQIEDLV